MPGEEFGDISATPNAERDRSSFFEDRAIPCIDCAREFIWTAGEQEFFRDKDLKNPPKRCKACKRMKNDRLSAIEAAQMTGKKMRIEVSAECAKCGSVTTVPFFPSQGRPVYCRTCYIEITNQPNS